MPTQVEAIKNMMRCNRFESCNRNQCPLDHEIDLRVGGAVCLYMQDGDGQPRPTNTGKGMVTFVMGAQMPDDLLVYVPRGNVAKLNSRSKARWDMLAESREAAKSGCGHSGDPGFEKVAMEGLRP